MRLSAVACFACMSAGVKLASERGASVPEMLFYRNVFTLPLVLAWIVSGPGFATLRTQRPMAHLSRAAIGLLTMALTFLALRMLPLTEATVITFSVPFFATALSALVLREHVGSHRWLAIVAGFVGVLITLQPGGTHISPTGAAVALAAAMSGAWVTITLRQIGVTESATATVFWFTVASSAVTATALPWFAQMHDAHTWSLLLLIGLLGGATQLLSTASLRFAPISTLAPFDYSQLLWATVLGWWIWDSKPSAATWTGATLIVASGLYIVHRERRLRLRAAAEAVAQRAD